MSQICIKTIWKDITALAEKIADKEAGLRPVLEESVLKRASFSDALAHRLGRKLGNHATHPGVIIDAIGEVLAGDSKIIEAVAVDAQAVCERDPACQDLLTPLLYFKGFLALSAHRIAHALYQNDRQEMALYFQSLVSESFSVDIHPAAVIGQGILLDHATSFVAGETTVIDDNVSILHEVTLGGTGKERGDRHPKVRSGVLLGAGAKILGNVEIGEGAKVGAGSVVLNDVPPHVSVAGVPARIVAQNRDFNPAFGMDHKLED